MDISAQENPKPGKPFAPDCPRSAKLIRRERLRNCQFDQGGDTFDRLTLD